MKFGSGNIGNNDMAELRLIKFLRSKVVIPISILMIMTTFIADFFMPTGYALSLPYAGAVILSGLVGNGHKKLFIKIIAIISCLLIVIGGIFSPGNLIVMGWFNRFHGIAVVLLCMFINLYHWNKRKDLKETYNENLVLQKSTKTLIKQMQKFKKNMKK